MVNKVVLGECFGDLWCVVVFEFRKGKNYKGVYRIYGLNFLFLIIRWRY